MNAINEETRRAVINATSTGYVEALQLTIAADYSKNYKNLTPPTVEIEIGRRYIKIVKASHFNGHSTRSVQGFVDLTNGDILKAASWKAPAKHARGNVLDPACIANNWNITPHGHLPYIR